MHNNEITGTVSSDTCNIRTLAPDSKHVENMYGFNLRGITTDCRNDVLTSDVTCTCCSYCQDKSPTWSSECADTTIKIKIDHKPSTGFFTLNSDELVWSLIENASRKLVAYDG